MKILMAASEANPFAKTGGLADVTGSLPAALKEQGADVRIILPKYGTIDSTLRESIRHICHIYIKINWRNQYCGIEEAEYNGVTYYFIDNEFYFKREGLYGYGDDGERFAFFNRAVLEALPLLDFIPDIIHCHDWQTGMIPVLLEAQYRQVKDYQGISTVFTIHNLRYQGIFKITEFKDWFGLGDEYFAPDKLEYHGSASFLKGGLVYSKLLTTVSPSYADEIRCSFYGEGLEGMLNARSHELFGILNGIDYEEYNPKKDAYICRTYSKSSLNKKNENKTALQKELNLTIGEEIPMICMISRLVDQKGLDLLSCVLDEILNEDLQLVVLGAGDTKYEAMLKAEGSLRGGKISVNIRFDNALAHKIYAAGDLFLMPSKFEPCGLGQMIALRYGTLPIVRETGGLKDTVLSYNEETREGNGFSFANYNAHDMLYTIKRALSIYRKKTIWNRLRKAAMSCDYSWQASARKYMELYYQLKPEVCQRLQPGGELADQAEEA